MRKSVESLKANSLEVTVSSKHLEEQCSNNIQKIYDRIVNKAHLPSFIFTKNKIPRMFFSLQNSWRWWWRWVAFVVWLTDERRLSLLPFGTIVRDPHHREFSTRREQDLNLRGMVTLRKIHKCCSIYFN